MTTVIELPRRTGPRTFAAAPDDLAERLRRALDALGDLPDGFNELPGMDELGAALVALCDALDEGDDNEN
jgi:hypothetical protein